MSAPAFLGMRAAACTQNCQFGVDLTPSGQTEFRVHIGGFGGVIFSSAGVAAYRPAAEPLMSSRMMP